MKPQVVRFASHPHPFSISVDQCQNVECPCADVTFHFREVAETGQSVGSAAAFEACVNPETWVEVNSPQRNAPELAMVTEFLRDYPAEERLVFAERARKKRVLAQRLREYRLDLNDDEIERGTLVAYSEIASENGSIGKGGHAFGYRVEYQGREFLIEDMYCSNPNCNCKVAHLRFFEYTPGAGPDASDLLKEAFLGKVTFDGKFGIEEYHKWNRPEADQIVSEWWKQFSDEIPVLKWRYGKVKEVARRSRRKPTTSSRVPARIGAALVDRPAISIASAAGRNDPCPCGSGKKYKRCCGA